MGTLTIRNLDDDLKQRIRRRAAEHGRSMEEEARRLLDLALTIRSDEEVGLAEAIRRRFAAVGGVDLQLPPRETAREPPDFSSPEYEP